MQLLLVAAILLAYGPNFVITDFNSDIEQSVCNKVLTELVENLNKERDEEAKKLGMKAKVLKPTESLKVPEIDCGRNYFEESLEFGKELREKYPSDDRKQMEEAEAEGEETFATCALLSRTEVNCKSKVCEDKDPVTLCICGPKKCKMDSDGLCEEKDGSSSLFVCGTIINLTIFYLISSFF
ncbi:hypothetical protein CRE_26740 [Caenorhabditis remanei]|uniref:Uncharacterized protein n=1 Tax=Caenorhabditis remanei TaxID=31234 RepID=E3MXS6_CAERE|nr:hypothetical protein CRE_26740 [Caenorhabditis remanei]